MQLIGFIIIISHNGVDEYAGRETLDCTHSEDGVIKFVRDYLHTDTSYSRPLKSSSGKQVQLIAAHAIVSGDSSVGIAYRHGLDGPGSNGGEIFPTRSDRLWGQPSLLYNGYSSRGVVLATHPHLAPRLKK